MPDPTLQHSALRLARHAAGEDEIARRLWGLWRGGQRPRVEEFLAAAGVTDAAVLLAVLRVDQLERFRLGEWVKAETYLAAFPAVRDDPELAVDLVFAEFLLREEAGQAPADEEYQRRFPAHAEELRLQFELHRAMASGAGPSTRCGDESETLVGPQEDGPGAGPGQLPAIPGFDVLGVLGRGGMGVVYRARQVELNRPVALKMVTAGALATPSILARFRVEAEAVARARHPNIVQIHDVGQHAGAPFLVLELADGGSLAHRIAGTPQPARWAAELVETLARAIHAAHGQGVIHRDLTPANILLTADGTPKVTDFGLAKLLVSGSDLRTQTGELLGTPSYMAPEQAAGRHREIGPAADVYALGAILYELLTGRPPFKAASVAETLELVRGADPPPPGRLAPGLPRDLETICLKCLHKDPSRRYPTAEALAEDLERFLAGEPIRARPVSAVERLARWARRKPAAAALLVTLTLGPACAAAAMTVLWLRAERLRQTAEANRDRADANLKAARAAVDECFTVAAEDDLLRGPGLQPARRLLLGAALKYYQGFVRRHADDPALRAELARNLTRVGIITREVGTNAEALASLLRGLAIFEDVHAARPDDIDLARGLARTLHEVALVHESSGRTDEALGAVGRAVEVREGIAAARPDDALDQNALATSIQLRSDLEMAVGRTAEALRSVERAVAIRERLAAGGPTDATLRHDLAMSLVNLGVIQREAGRTDQALKSWARAVEILERLAAERPGLPLMSSSLGIACINLGVLLGEVGRPEDAIRADRRAVEVLERLASANPSVYEYRRQLGYAHGNLGDLQFALGDLDEARSSAARAIEIRAALASAHPDVVAYRRDLARSDTTLGAIHYAHGRYEEAAVLWERATAIDEALLAEFPSVVEYQDGLARGLSNLGAVQQEIGRMGDALRSLSRSVEIHERLAAAHPEVTLFRNHLVTAYGNLNEIQLKVGQDAEALRSYRKVRELMEGLPNPRPVDFCTLASTSARMSGTAVGGSAELEDRAIEALRRAVAAGYRNRDLLDRDHAFDPLRPRADFRALMLDLAFPADPFATTR